MSLPSFFESVAWSVRFQGDATVREDAVRAAALAFRPVVHVDQAAATDGGCADGARLLVNLLARTYGTVGIVAPPALAAELQQLACDINADVEFANPPDGTVIAFGAGPTDRPVTLFAGGSGWRAVVSRSHPVATDPYPIAAMVAGALAAGELFRTAFAPLLPASWEPMQEANWSLLDHVLDGSDRPGPPWPTEVRLGNVFFVGIGAIGNAALYGLRRFDGVSGTLHLIDNQTVESSNLQRYVLASAEDAARHRTKVLVGQRSVKRPGLGVRPHVETWDNFLATWPGGWSFSRIVTSPDSASARQAVQAALPREVLNAGIGRSVLDVGRYTFDGRLECLNCAYAHTPSPPLFDLMRETFGLSPARLQELEDRNLGLTPNDIAVIEAHVRLPGKLGHLLGQGVRSAHMRMCGYVAPALAATNEAALVPAAHVPVLAGLLLGLELVKASVPTLAPYALAHVLQWDVRYALTPGMRLTHIEKVAAVCICTDARYRAAFAEKWPTPNGS